MGSTGMPPAANRGIPQPQPGSLRQPHRETPGADRPRPGIVVAVRTRATRTHHPGEAGTPQNNRNNRGNRPGTTGATGSTAPPARAPVTVTWPEAGQAERERS